MRRPHPSPQAYLRSSCNLDEVMTTLTFSWNGGLNPKHGKYRCECSLQDYCKITAAFALIISGPFKVASGEQKRLQSQLRSHVAVPAAEIAEVPVQRGGVGRAKCLCSTCTRVDLGRGLQIDVSWREDVIRSPCWLTIVSTAWQGCQEATVLQASHFHLEPYKHSKTCLTGVPPTGTARPDDGSSEGGDLPNRAEALVQGGGLHYFASPRKNDSNYSRSLPCLPRLVLGAI